MRFLVSVLLGGSAFALLSATIIQMLCYTKVFSSCSDSSFQPLALLIFGVEGIFISLLSCVIHLAAQRLSWYSTLYILPIFLFVGLFAPMTYLLLTAPEPPATFVFIDVVFGPASLGAGVVALVLRYRRSNNDVQTTPAAGRD